jgi:hypothetical protein
VVNLAGAIAGASIAKAMTVRKMKKLKATSEETAKKPEELGVHKSYLDKLVRLGRVKRTEDDRYYVECKDGKHC